MSYEEIGRIPYNSRLKIEYGLKDGESFTTGSPDYAWSYVDYKGITGWVNTMQYGEGFDFGTALESNSKYTGELLTVESGLRLSAKAQTVDETGVYNQNTYVSGKIPKGILLKFGNYYKNAKDQYVYTEYNGIKGWLLLDVFPGYDEEYVTSMAVGMRTCVIARKKSGAKIYTEPFDKGSFTGKYLPCDNVTASDMYAENYHPGSDSGIREETFRVTVGGVTGWVTTVNTSPSLAYDIKEDYGFRVLNAKTGISVYPVSDETSDSIATIPRGGSFVCVVSDNISDWNYVKSGEISGWARISKDVFEYSDKKIDCSSFNEYYNYIRSPKESNVKIATATDMIPTTVAPAGTTVSGEETTDEVYYGEFTVEETLAGEVLPDDEDTEQSPAKSMEK